MTEKSDSLAGRVALVTGAAHRIGATIARRLHGAGMDIALHYRSSESA
ncbi:MAG: pteridine reductase, partial [Candidatus Sedimenticola sp. 6PFRAG5]